MTIGKVAISIDLELAWGVWDTATADDLRMAETAERPICVALLDLFDRYQVPASWLVVAHRRGFVATQRPSWWVDSAARSSSPSSANSSAMLLLPGRSSRPHPST